MSTTIDVDKLIVDINQKLPPEQQIRRDDPMYSAVVLNTAVINTYVQVMQQKLDETLHQLTIVSQQQAEKAAAVAENISLSSGDKIEKQLDIAVQRGEERLKSQIRWASRLAWTGALLITIPACVYVGSWLGNTIADITHLQKSSLNQNNRIDSAPVDRHLKTSTR